MSIKDLLKDMEPMDIDPEALKNAKQMLVDLDAKIAAIKPSDISTDKIQSRIGMVAVMGGVSRTTVLGSAFFSGLYGPVVGISKEQLVAAVCDAYDVAVNNPNTAEMAVTFAESNKEYHQQQAIKDANPQAFLVAGNDKIKH